MTTPEQIQAWSREAETPVTKSGVWRVLSPETLQRFADLARADLVAERDALMTDYNNVSMENEELRTRLLAVACEQVDIENALKAEVEALRKDATHWKSSVQTAYGHLWHINNEPMAPIPLYSEEAASYQARKALRDLLTHEERGIAINTIDAAMEKTK
jgi:regulator of replication initiation timing